MQAPTLVPAKGAGTATLLTGPSGENVTIARPAPEGPSPPPQALARPAADASAESAAPRFSGPRSPAGGGGASSFGGGAAASSSVTSSGVAAAPGVVSSSSTFSSLATRLSTGVACSSAG